MTYFNKERCYQGSTQAAEAGNLGKMQYPVSIHRAGAIPHVLYKFMTQTRHLATPFFFLVTPVHYAN